MILSVMICFIRLMNTSHKEIFSHTKRMMMRFFLGDCREAYVVSNSYGMGDPLAPSEVEGNSGGVRHHPSATV